MEQVRGIARRVDEHYGADDEDNDGAKKHPAPDHAPESLPTVGTDSAYRAGLVGGIQWLTTRVAADSAVTER